jgi:hypothetical protein
LRWCFAASDNSDAAQSEHSLTHFYRTMKASSVSSPLTAWVTMARLALGFYIYGATVLEVFVYYPAWIHIKNDWVAFKILVDQLIIPLYVVPCFLVLIPSVMMFWYRPASIPRWSVWAALILLLIPTVSTLAIQLPIQLALEKGFDQTLYEKLRSTDLLYRQIAAFAGFVLNGWMLLRVLQHQQE